MPFVNKVIKTAAAALWFLGLPVAALEQDAASLVLVQKVLKAYGGAQQIESVVSLNAEGLINAQLRHASGTYKRWFQRPRKLRVETSYASTSEARILNGDLAWRISDESLMMGVAGPGRLAMIYQYKQLDLPYELLKGSYNLRYAGAETVGSVATQAIEVWDDEGPAIRMNVDTTEHYIVKVTGSITSGAQTMTLSIEFSDFRLIDGTPLPFQINNYADGIHISETLMTRYGINPAVNPALFVPRVKGRDSALSRFDALLAAVRPSMSDTNEP